MRIHFEPHWLPKPDDWLAWALNEIPWVQCQDPEYHHTLPRLTSWFCTNPDGLSPMDDRLSTLTTQLNDYLWLDLSEVNCFLLRNEDHKLGWKEGGDRCVVFLNGDRKAMVKFPDKTRLDIQPSPGDLLVLPEGCLFSVPRTAKPKSTFIFLVFS